MSSAVADARATRFGSVPIDAVATWGGKAPCTQGVRSWSTPMWVAGVRPGADSFAAQPSQPQDPSTAEADRAALEQRKRNRLELLGAAGGMAALAVVGGDAAIMVDMIKDLALTWSSKKATPDAPQPPPAPTCTPERAPLVAGLRGADDRAVLSVPGRLDPSEELRLDPTTERLAYQQVASAIARDNRRLLWWRLGVHGTALASGLVASAFLGGLPAVAAVAGINIGAKIINYFIARRHQDPRSIAAATERAPALAPALARVDRARLSRPHWVDRDEYGAVGSELRRDYDQVLTQMRAYNRRTTWKARALTFTSRLLSYAGMLGVMPATWMSVATYAAGTALSFSSGRVLGRRVPIVETDKRGVEAGPKLWLENFL